MFSLLKIFGGKILKSKFGGMVSGLFGGWQLYALIGILFGGYIIKLKVNLWDANRKLENQIEKTAKVQAKLDLKIIHLKTCSTINTEVNQEVVRAVKLANECKAKFTEAKERNEAQIQLMANRKKVYENDIEKIKKIQAVTDCDNEPLDKSTSDWLLGKTKSDSEDES